MPDASNGGTWRVVVYQESDEVVYDRVFASRHELSTAGLDGLVERIYDDLTHDEILMDALAAKKSVCPCPALSPCQKPDRCPRAGK